MDAIAGTVAGSAVSGHDYQTIYINISVFTISITNQNTQEVKKNARLSLVLIKWRFLTSYVF